MDPYAPITPGQEAELETLLAGFGRLTRERIQRGLRGASAGEAADVLRKLRGEPTPPPAVEAPVDVAATRAGNAALRAKLDAGYAGRAMQPIGLSQPSLFAGINGHYTGATR